MKQPMLSHFDQAEFDLKCEWGLNGLRALQHLSDAVVIVDVLSFSTAVDIALSNGASVLPYRWTDSGQESFAETNGAVLAGRRTASGYTLSPASLLSIPPGTVLVLPSPNGSTLSLESAAIPTFAACLRNAPAVANRARSCGSRIAVIPAGEQWSENSLRPCLEDLLGAGALLAELPGIRSPEVEMAVAAFQRFQGSLAETLRRCGSGKELVQRGFGTDVELAAEYAVSTVAPMLENGRFIDSQLLPHRAPDRGPR